MIIPSIDIMGGHAVQLVGGREKKIDAGDPRPLLERFSRVGEVAVIDLDAAMGKGSNAALIAELVKRAPCRVGGGIRDVDTAKRWLDAGASKVILGTRAVPDILTHLPRERVIAALDAVDGEVVVEGWTTKTGQDIRSRMVELRALVGGFLITFVEREGRLGGTDLDRVHTLIQEAGDARLTIAGGVTTAAEIATLDRLGADAQVGMALYTDRISLADAFAAPLQGDGPWSTVVVNRLGVALDMVASDRARLARAIEGDFALASGMAVPALRLDVNATRDVLRLRVDTGLGPDPALTATAWGTNTGLGALAQRLYARTMEAPEGSYTRRLLDDPAKLRGKLLEEAQELAAATDGDEAVWETADVIYFALVALARAGRPLADVADMLDRRALKVKRRE